MYHLLVYRSPSPLFTHEQGAFRLLRMFQAWVEKQHCILVDYLLVTHSIQLIVEGGTIKSGNACLSKHQLNDAQLLACLAHLGKLGKQYPYSGTYELYHASGCYASLGKAGYDSLPYTLSVIMQVKCEQSHKRIAAVFGDEIA